MKVYPQMGFQPLVGDLMIDYFERNLLIGNRIPLFQANRFARTADKSKGLRHFSTKVCEKVKEKGRTNYNEVIFFIFLS